ncbi:MAG TPA: hypothetical protein VH170_05880 [Chthoniobacterales bacterium]|nr:hypothetical protein [Chthoniobacterales bacterium]
MIGKDSDWCFGPRFVWLNNVPEITGAEQDCYSWMVFRASDDGIFRGSLRQLANDVRCSREHLQRNVIHSLLDRLLIERIDRGRGRAAWFRFVDPEQLGWRTKITTPPGELPSPLLANLMPRPGEETSPHKERVKEQPERTINRATRAQDERDLLEQIRRIVGNLEMSENGGAWRMRIRHCRKAVQFAIEDWKMRTPASPSIKVSPAAWLMDRHARALVEIDKAKAHSA